MPRLFILWLLWCCSAHALSGVCSSAAIRSQDDPKTASPNPIDEPSIARTPQRATWFKGNLHTHTLWSDGDDFPEMVADWYRQRGYHFLALSDHNILSVSEKWIPLSEVEKRGGNQVYPKYQQRFPGQWIETQGDSGSQMKIRLKTLPEIQAELEIPGQFLLIPAEEITDKGVHINATNIGELIEPQGGTSFVETVRNNLRAVAEQTTRTGREILPSLNHPNLGDKGVTPEELAWVTENRFFEVWNGVEGDGDLGSIKRHSLERMWDITTTLRLAQYQAPPMFGLATDDSHDYHGKQRAKPGRGWVMVRADSLSTAAILAALKAGDFYSSTGVELAELEYDPVGRRLRLEVKPDGDAEFTINFLGTPKNFDPNTVPRTDPTTGEVVAGVLDYSADVGKVLASTTGLRAEYPLTGAELYVRAEVISSKAPEFPTTESPLQKAWTQPYGWRDVIATKVEPKVEPKAEPKAEPMVETNLESTRAALKVVEQVGPMLGAVDDQSARILVRRDSIPSTFQLSVMDGQGQTVATLTEEAKPESDFVVHFQVVGLRPESTYRYQLTQIVDGKVAATLADDDFVFRTATRRRQGLRQTACFMSCVDIEANPLWDDIAKLKPDLIGLLGDTPYIDNTDLTVVRQRHREFLNIPVLSRLIRHTPTVGTWDDHDFGANNANGKSLADGKQRTRQGFAEYRAHHQYGNGREGVYHKVDMGMFEIFFLDPRYFSQTAPSPVNAASPTCFGAEQWAWLLQGLKESQAPFKVLALGAIWQDKKNSETDDMFTYWYERDGLFDYIAAEKISGVVLLGGDIHVSRHLIHRDRVNYDLHDFIISPGHARVITSLNVFHPDLEWSLVEGHQFLTLSADGTLADPKLTVNFQQGGGRIQRTLELPLSQLTPTPSTGIRHKLRAHWNFEADFKNQTQLGERMDAIAKNGASISESPSKDKGAVQLFREKEQYVVVPKNPLDDNSREHTLSLWMRPTSLPKHGSSERQFLFESTATEVPSPQGAWHLSLGLRGTASPEDVNLQLYTYTLVPDRKPGVAPSFKSQGGFDYEVPRKRFEAWTHVAVVYDSQTMTLYVNGKPATVHQLPNPGPAAEFGGMIIGGHREGKGRNFDGFIDEVALWSRRLTADEIALLAAKRQSLHLK